MLISRIYDFANNTKIAYSRKLKQAKIIQMTVFNINIYMYFFLGFILLFSVLRRV